MLCPSVPAASPNLSCLHYITKKALKDALGFGTVMAICSLDLNHYDPLYLGFFNVIPDMNDLDRTHYLHDNHVCAIQYKINMISMGVYV